MKDGSTILQDYSPVGIKKAWKQSSVAFYCAPSEGTNCSLPLEEKKKEKKNLFAVELEKARPNSLPLEKFLQIMVVWRLFQQLGNPRKEHKCIFYMLNLNHLMHWQGKELYTAKLKLLFLTSDQMGSCRRYLTASNPATIKCFPCTATISRGIYF